MLFRSEAKTIAMVLERSGLAHELAVIQDANRAIAFLNHSHPFESTPLPNLVLVGLPLPSIGGVAVLAELGQQRAAGHPISAVVVFSRSDDTKSRDAARVLGADAYFVKPVSAQELQSAASNLREVWGRLAGGATRGAL